MRTRKLRRSRDTKAKGRSINGNGACMPRSQALGSPLLPRNNPRMTFDPPEGSKVIRGIIARKESGGRAWERGYAVHAFTLKDRFGYVSRGTLNGSSSKLVLKVVSVWTIHAALLNCIYAGICLGGILIAVITRTYILQCIYMYKYTLDNHDLRSYFMIIIQSIFVYLHVYTYMHVCLLFGLCLKPHLLSNALGKHQNGVPILSSLVLHPLPVHGDPRCHSDAGTQPSRRRESDRSRSVVSTYSQCCEWLYATAGRREEESQSSHSVAGC